jgi:ferredoxin-NADP reductase
LVGYRERQFYLCGPPPKVEVLTEVLRSELQIPEEQIKTEGFIGY